MTRTTPPKRRAARQPQKRKRAASASKAPQPQRVAVLLGLAVLAVVVWLVASARPATHDTATHPDGSLLNVVTNPALPEEILEREDDHIVQPADTSAQLGVLGTSRLRDLRQPDPKGSPVRSPIRRWRPRHTRRITQTPASTADIWRLPAT